MDATSSLFAISMFPLSSATGARKRRQALLIQLQKVHSSWLSIFHVGLSGLFVVVVLVVCVLLVFIVHKTIQTVLWF